MLIEFRFKNYRSFRDEAILSMEAAGLGTFKNSLITYNNSKLLPGAAIYGKNGGGKSNVIRAFWLAVQFIKNAQRTQHEKAVIPVIPFALNDYSVSEPSEFDFIYTLDGLNTGIPLLPPEKRFLQSLCTTLRKDKKALVFSERDKAIHLQRIRQDENSLVKQLLKISCFSRLPVR